jgi:hypothetical protein
MSTSRKNPRKKSRGRPPVDSEQVNLRIQRPLLDAIDAYAAGDGMSRPEAIRRLVEAGLTVAKPAPRRRARQSIPVDQLTAENDD